jgi:hypothetical protein
MENPKEDDIDFKSPQEIVSGISIIFFLFFILTAFSFGIERWIDPEFLKLKPENFGVGKHG